MCEPPKEDSPEQRILNAQAIAAFYGDKNLSSDEKTWVIDQMIRALSGCYIDEMYDDDTMIFTPVDIYPDRPTEEYKEWLKTIVEIEEYPWSKGIEPEIAKIAYREWHGKEPQFKDLPKAPE